MGSFGRAARAHLAGETSQSERFLGLPDPVIPRSRVPRRPFMKTSSVGCPFLVISERGRPDGKVEDGEMQRGFEVRVGRRVSACPPFSPTWFVFFFEWSPSRSASSKTSFVAELMTTKQNRIMAKRCSRLWYLILRSYFEVRPYTCSPKPPFPLI